MIEQKNMAKLKWKSKKTYQYHIWFIQFFTCMMLLVTKFSFNEWTDQIGNEMKWENKKDCDVSDGCFAKFVSGNVFL